jgi:hypothetical protein
MTQMLTALGKSRAKVEYLATQLGIANTHLYLFTHLRAAQEGQLRKEMYKSLDFWHYTLGAHIQAVIVHLCRLYDYHGPHPRGRALHLLLFVEETDESKLNTAELALRQSDLQFLQRANPNTGAAPNLAVSKLRAWRNNLVAHRDYDLSLGGIAEFLKQFPVDLLELQTLIDRGFEILDRWKDYYGFEGQIQRLATGKDDYTFVLNALRRSHQQPSAGSMQGTK